MVPRNLACAEPPGTGSFPPTPRQEENTHRVTPPAVQTQMFSLIVRKRDSYIGMLGSDSVLTLKKQNLRCGFSKLWCVNNAHRCAPRG